MRGDGVPCKRTPIVDFILVSDLHNIIVIEILQSSSLYLIANTTEHRERTSRISNRHHAAGGAVVDRLSKGVIKISESSSLLW